MSDARVSEAVREAEPAEAILGCRDVTKVYRGEGASLLDRLRGRRGGRPAVTALDGVTLEVASGEIVGIAGPSGSGKSTLLHALAGLVEPTAGSVTFDGVEITALSDRERTRHRLDHVGLVFQRFHLIDALSARGNVALPLIEQGIGRRARRERASEALAQVGLEDRLAHKPAELSGGEQQRVAIARALVTDPAVVLADEPTGELDTETGSRVLACFAELAPDRTVVIASHDREALAVCDRVVELVDGRIAGERP